MDGCPNSPVYAVIYEENIANSPKDLFHNLKDASKFANSPEGKANGARFKKFSSTEEAANFLSSGDYPLSPLATSRSMANEPIIPSPSLKITDYTVLKKTIEKGDLMRFCELVDSNPRYLINTSGDTASILMEGQRYNALHIAARNGKSLFVTKILSYLTDVKFVMNCYGTDEEDARPRMQNILTSILNTPDKGQWNTPLHIAAKLGHVDVVRALLAESLLNKSPFNKEKKTPLEESCSGYHKEDKTERKKEIELLLNGVYIALYRAPDNTQSPKLVVAENIPSCFNASSSRLDDTYQLAAVAGPFYSKDESEDFYQRWTQNRKDVKRQDIDKHLSLLNSYFSSLRKGDIGNDPARTRLNFEDSDSDDEFEDALDIPLDDSLAGLTKTLAGMSLNSPKFVPRIRESTEEDYLTPPSTPPPVYILGLPTKTDNDLYLALTVVDRKLLAPFPHIRFFMDKIAQMGQKTREWPSKDSPRVNRSVRRCIL